MSPCCIVTLVSHATMCHDTTHLLYSKHTLYMWHVTLCHTATLCHTVTLSHATLCHGTTHLLYCTLNTHCTCDTQPRVTLPHCVTLSHYYIVSHITLCCNTMYHCPSNYIVHVTCNTVPRCQIAPHRHTVTCNIVSRYNTLTVHQTYIAHVTCNTVSHCYSVTLCHISHCVTIHAYMQTLCHITVLQSMYTCKHVCYTQVPPLIFVTPMEINVTRLSDNALRGPHVFCTTCSSPLYTLYIHIYTHTHIYIYIFIHIYIHTFTIYILYIPYHYRCWRIWQTVCTHDSWEADSLCLLPQIPRTFCLTIMQIIHVILLCILILNTSYTCNITLYPDTGDRTCHPVSHILHVSIPFHSYPPIAMFTHPSICTVHSTALYTVLHSTQYCTVHSTAQYTVLHSTQYCTVHSTILYTVLHCTQY